MLGLIRWGRVYTRLNLFSMNAASAYTREITVDALEQVQLLARGVPGDTVEL